MLKNKLRNVKQKIKQTKWLPTHLQSPEPLQSRRYPNDNLSADYLARPAQECGFLSVLLPEIREMIYEYVFADPPLTYKKEVDETLTALEGIRYPVNCLWRVPGRLSAKPPRRYSHNYAANRLSILLACKKTYAEAIDQFYKSSTFLISDVSVVFDFSRALIPQRLDSVHHLQLQFLLQWPDIKMWWDKANGTPDNKHLWQKMWNTMAQEFTGLRTLRLYIRQWTWDFIKPNAETEARVLQPIKQLRGLQEFTLWYRHAKVRDPFGGDYDEKYTFDIIGEECQDDELEEVRKELCEMVKLPRNAKGEETPSTQPSSGEG